MSDDAKIDPLLLKSNLPDSRRQHHRPTVCGRFGLMSQVYCANCGADGGQITEEWARHVFYLCDDCAAKWGPHASLLEVPDETVRGALP